MGKYGNWNGHRNAHWAEWMLFLTFLKSILLNLMLLSRTLWLKSVKIHGDADCISTHTIHGALSLRNFFPAKPENLSPLYEKLPAPSQSDFQCSQNKAWTNKGRWKWLYEGKGHSSHYEGQFFSFWRKRLSILEKLSHLLSIFMRPTGNIDWVIGRAPVIKFVIEEEEEEERPPSA